MNSKKAVYVFILLIMIGFQFALPYPARAACSGIVYVDATASSVGANGCSWGTAFPKLQSALGIASTSDQIWVADGTYYPDEGTGQVNDDPNSTFLLRNGVAVYGGFTGSETLLSQRNSNPATNNTILSGDIGILGNSTDNAFNVVTGDSTSTNAALDGFTILSGNAAGSGNGGGILVGDSSPSFSNLIVRNNTGDFGGGIYNYTTDHTVPEASYSHPSFTNVTVSSNTAVEGGGMQATNASPVLNNVIFNANTASAGAGGGMYANTFNFGDAPSIPKLTNVTFSNNTARGGGGMYNGNTTAIINQVTFSGNTALRRGGGVLNENASPSFTNVTFYGNTSLESLGTTPWGGGAMINIAASNVTINNATFSGNNSVNGSGTAGGDAIRNTESSSLVIRNTILWGDTNDEINSDGTGTITISDSVVQGGFAGGTNIKTTNPNLSALASNGGFTQTMAIGAGSSALDAGGVTTACAPTDQRGVARPQGPACDIGAYELSAGLTVTINQAAGQLDPTNTSPINFTVVFSQSVSDFATGDVTLSGTAGATTATVTGSGTTYNVAVSGMTTNGTVVATIAAGVATNGSGSSNQASTSTDNSVTYDATAPTVTINQAVGQADPTNTSPINFTVVFSEPVANFATGDVTLSGTAGATTATVTGSGTTYNVAVSGMAGDGTVTVSIAAGAATDTAGNNNTASTSTDNTVTYDTTSPTVTINQAAGQLDPTNTSPINFTVVFSEPVSNFATGDVSLSGTAGATTATVTGSGTTYNVAVSGMTTNGTVIASIGAGVATDAAGNNNAASTSTDNTVTYDTTGPTVTINQAIGQADPTNTSPINYTVVFSEPVANFATGDVTLSGTAGATTATVTGSGTTYNVAVSGMTTNGTVIATIAASVATDTAGNNNAASTSTDNTVTYNTSVLTVTINQAAGQADPTNAAPINFTVIFSQAVSDFATGDVSLSGTAGATTATVTGSGTTYNVAVSGMTTDGTVIASVPAGVATNSAATSNQASTSTDNTVTYDTTGPTVTINQAAGQADPTNAAPINFTVIFSEPVANFATGDVTLSGTAGATTATVTGTGTTYNVAVSGMTSSGTVIADVAAGVATDAAGNSNVASSSTDNTVTYDNSILTVTINQAVGQADPTAASPINFTVIFSQAVSDFATGDVALSGTAGATTATVTGSGTTYNVAVSGMTGDGTVIASIAAGVATNGVGTSNQASTSTDNTVTYATAGTAVTINQATGQTDPTAISPINFTVVFAGPVSGFTTGDVTISGTAGATTQVITQIAPNDGTTYNVAVSGMSTSGTVIVTVAAGVAQDGLGNGNLASTSTDNTVTFDLGYPTVSSSVPSNNATLTTGPVRLTVRFSKDVKNDGSATAANNTANYLLVEDGANNTFDTASCKGGLVIDDTQITINSATYSNNGGSGPFVATLNINSGTPLSVGHYRLFVCGTTSIEDLAGNTLNNGASDSIVTFDVIIRVTAGLPKTGFPMNKVTALPAQPIDQAYASTDLWLEIPKLNVKMSIVGVPFKDGGWNVNWLDKNAGWLNGSAFPTWNGNSVLTGHVWDALNQPGPFAKLKDLKYGDQVKIHAFGQVYTYEIRESALISPANSTAMLKHEDKSWLTLITCEDYKETTETYSYRRLVRAVLVNAAAEK